MKKEKKPAIQKATSSLARAQDVDTEQEWAIEPVGSPEEFGFPVKPTTAQVRCWTNQELFLDALARTGSIGAACSESGVGVPNAEYWNAKDTYGFKRRKADALQAFLGKVEAEINRRAIEGVDHPVIHQGVITDTYKQYSDNLLMFRAKRLDPQYRDNYSDANKESGAAPVTQIIINLAPGVEMPEEVEGQTHYREVRPAAEGEYREIPEGDEG